MTLILAAKHEKSKSLVTVSDTVGSSASGKEYYVQKVREIPYNYGRIILGLAGLIMEPENVFRRYSDATKNFSWLYKFNNPIKKLQHLVYNDYNISFDSLIEGNHETAIYLNQYLFGIYQKLPFQNDGIGLYVHDPSQIDLNSSFYNSPFFLFQFQLPYHDLGVKLPEVRELLQEAYNRKLDLDGLISSMKDALDRAKSITENKIRGTQIGILNHEGYKILEFSNR